MHLGSYLKQRGLTQAEFAAMFDPPVTQGLVSQWLRGESRMTLDQALQTLRITDGAVAPEDCAALYAHAGCAAN
ncbi:helix-turn-helix domain-containing protein [Cupriavidus gilardii]|uniref:Helix-turn-helix domain-containing protein n=1 Tax=Cupriavidus gilardii TaxID=82541 RepID=A0ABY4VT19_9BURK|nr:helix-turn-helix transcriptional regulator [Cupriavidus gilardii]USE78936.1 helix-turn-helix domain-containing protein [Cupriavidus gilardii]